MTNKKSISVKVEQEIFKKMKYISQKEYRTLSGQLVYLMENNIRVFEKNHGKI